MNIKENVLKIPSGSGRAQYLETFTTGLDKCSIYTESEPYGSHIRMSQRAKGCQMNA